MEALNRYLVNNKTFRAVLKPFAPLWVKASGYRRLGLRYDDIVIEESPEAQEAMRRLDDDVMQARIYRMKRAFQLDSTMQELPKDQWTKPSEDKEYFLPVIEQVRAEVAERKKFDSLKLEK
ncbi:Cytochrome b-c1 complex subunit 7 [Zancudomyces culisetae]|uniref:Cytochrome b-c1 complex subunit 7 n=1 Tax=Zancudomyces culisetae TaxID=1213189 RepID=A0A1R1PTL1_ZANCU|nr:Cytochrome b-c1 complex subunit 7 [Zancudomyces culisetae]|eukprot:OMH84243.1 Cytochrome b-c1 complex subunit 7 [Zancudomyces culisetae]